MNRDRFDSEQDKIRELRNEIDSLKNKNEKKIAELEKELRIKTEQLLQKDVDIRLREDRIQREQKFLDELEKNNQGKLLEF